MSPRCLWSHGGPQTPLMRFLLQSFRTKVKRHVPVCSGVPRPPRPLTCPFSVQSRSSQGRLPGPPPRHYAESWKGSRFLWPGEHDAARMARPQGTALGNTLANPPVLGPPW